MEDQSEHSRRAAAALSGTRFRVEWVDETGSTNTDLVDAARNGAEEGLVRVADHQTAGRGRLGRAWVAPPGSSLLCSVLVRPEIDPAQAHLVTLALALGALDACRDVAGVPAHLKWPNDLVIDDRKVGGLLAESVVSGGRLEAVVVGIGLNVAWTRAAVLPLGQPPEVPAEVAAIATSLDEHRDGDLDRVDLLVTMLLGFDARYRALVGGQATTLLAEARELSATVGRPVRVELAHETFEGRAAALGPSGELVVATDGGDRTVTVGDVTHLRHTGPA